MKFSSFYKSIIAIATVSSGLAAPIETEATTLGTLQDERLADITTVQEELKSEKIDQAAALLESFAQRDKNRIQQIGILSAKLEAARAAEPKTALTLPAEVPALLHQKAEMMASIDAVRAQANLLPVEQRAILFAQWEQANAAKLSAMQQQIAAESLTVMAKTPLPPVRQQAPIPNFTSPIPWNAPAQFSHP